MKQKLTQTLCMLYVILGCWRGYIALFDKGQTEPRQIFPTEVITLPPADQEALEKGIILRNQRDLNRLLEDYLS